MTSQSHTNHYVKRHGNTLQRFCKAEYVIPCANVRHKPVPDSFLTSQEYGPGPQEGAAHHHMAHHRRHSAYDLLSFMRWTAAWWQGAPKSEGGESLLLATYHQSMPWITSAESFPTCLRVCHTAWENRAHSCVYTVLCNREQAQLSAETATGGLLLKCMALSFTRFIATASSKLTNKCPNPEKSAISSFNSNKESPMILPYLAENSCATNLLQWQ